MARYYKHQLVDHFDENNTATWSNRYYQSNKYFKGAGHPIIIIVGGEGALDHGMLYPFVTEVLAKQFGAAVLEIEHRYYGQSIPLVNATSLQLLQLLTPAQAMADMVQLTKHVRDTEFTACSPDRTSPDYCPVITVGASYPGFLSFLFRIVHGDFVDIAYASSAPLLMYAQVSDPNSYYDIVTSANDRIVPGCSHAIRTTMEDMVTRMDSATSLTRCRNEYWSLSTSFAKLYHHKGGIGVCHYRYRQGFLCQLQFGKLSTFAPRRAITRHVASFPINN